MSLMNCKVLRATVVAAGVLFVLGIVLQAPRLLVADAPALTTLLSGVGLVAMMTSPVLLLAATLLSLFPGVSKSLNLCEH
jgi:hypothetical protein